MSVCKRKKTLVDRELQLGLSSRIFVYWCATWLAVFAIPMMTRLFMTDVSFSELGQRMISDLWFPMTMSFLVFPIVAYDFIRFSNRIAGPIWRLRQTIRDINDGEPVRMITLRKDDYCNELADEVNRLIEKSIDQTNPEVSTCDRELREMSNETAAS